MNARDIDTVIQILYESISGPAGQEPRWDQVRPLFFPGARMMKITRGADGLPRTEDRAVEAYIELTAEILRSNGFYEWEIARRTDRFGSVAQLFSTYEARHDRADPEPFKRGINSIQLFHDGERWWIINMIWEDEAADRPLPAEYLPAPG